MTRIGGGCRLLGWEWERRLADIRRKACGDLSGLGTAVPPARLFSVLAPIGWRSGTVRHEGRGLPPARSVSCWYGARLL
jgi:hypothetical protein